MNSNKCLLLPFFIFLDGSKAQKILIYKWILFFIPSFYDISIYLMWEVKYKGNDL